MTAQPLQKKRDKLLAQIRKLEAELAEVQRQIDESSVPDPAVIERRGEVLESRQAKTGGCFVLQRIKCGKPSCRCAKAGALGHGPYWYRYWKEKGRTRCKYVGKVLTKNEVVGDIK